MVGFVGALVLEASDTGTSFGLWRQFSGVAALATLPIALSESLLGVWLVVKSFKPSPILASETRDDGLNRTLAPAAAAR